MNMKTSVNGRLFLTSVEGTRLEAYNDATGRPTIGVGHLIKPNETFLLKNKITLQHAMELLSSDVVIAEHAINQYATVGLTQDMFDALVSFTFNEGVSAFMNSTLLKKLNSGIFAAVINEFRKWVYITKQEPMVATNGKPMLKNGVTPVMKSTKVISVGLVNRREREILLFTGKWKG